MLRPGPGTGPGRPGDDAAGAAWFEADALPAEVSFHDIQGRVLERWREAFRAEPQPRPGSDCQVFTTPQTMRRRTEQPSD